ncbi:MAG: phosphopantothenoylcysteine decarboxylase [Phycisphaerae bacterium]
MRILITAGPTREFFDSVRFLSNPSTGKMGYALARAAASRRHKVVLVSGPVALDPPSGVRCIRVVSAADMYDACRTAFRSCDVAIFTAAVCDYRPARRFSTKRAKKAEPWHMVLRPTRDIAAMLGRVKGRRITVGFAMEDHNGRAHAERKLCKKALDMIVLNGPQNVGSDRAQVEVLARAGTWVRWPGRLKSAVAERLIRELERLASNRLKRGDPKRVKGGLL